MNLNSNSSCGCGKSGSDKSTPAAALTLAIATVPMQPWGHMSLLPLYSTERSSLVSTYRFM